MEDKAEVINCTNNSRRIFLKAAGAAGVGLALLDSETMLWAAKPSKQETTGARLMNPVNPKTTAVVLIDTRTTSPQPAAYFMTASKASCSRTTCSPIRLNW